MFRRFSALITVFLYFVSCFLIPSFSPALVWAAVQPEESSVLLVDDFDAAHIANRLGGAFGAVAQGGDAGYEFTNHTGYPHLAAPSSLKFDYKISSASGYAFLWMKLGAPKTSPDETSFLNLSGMNFLTFRYLAPETMNFKIEIHEDLNQDGRFDIQLDRSSFIYMDSIKKFEIDGGWQKALVPLKRFAGIKDWSKVLELVFVFEKDRSGAAGEILLDDILFIRPELKKNVEDAGIQKIENASVKINGKALEAAKELNGQTEIQVDFKPVNGVSELESVILQMQAQGTDSWIPVVSDFAPTAHSAKLNWDAYSFSPPPSFSLRISSRDFYGAEEVIAGPWDGFKLAPLTDDSFLQLVSEKAFHFFEKNQNPENGLFYDTSTGGDASIAVTGFGLTAMVIGVERGWISRKDAEARVRLCLETFEKKLEQKEGFYYHFVNAKTLKRSGTAEISTVDTALFLAGAITAGEYFKGAIKKKADALYKRTNWPYFINMNPEEEHYLHFHHGWTPEDGISEHYWDYYTDETLLLDLLAIGSKSFPAPPEIFYHFVKREGHYKDGAPFIFTWHGALFSYQYANAWFDFRNVTDKDGINWFENSKRATIANRAFTVDHAGEYRTYDGDVWGITSMRIPERYVMHYGPLPNGQNRAVHDGTVAPSGPAGSIIFTPYYSLRALKHFYQNYPGLWGIYGFRDSLNVDRQWTSPIYYGLGEGILLQGIENFRSGLVWKVFSSNKRVQEGLRLAGFKKAEPKNSSNPEFEKWKSAYVAAPVNQKKNLLQQFLKTTWDYQAANSAIELAQKDFASPQGFDEALLLARLSYQRILALKDNDIELGREYLRSSESIKAQTLSLLNKADAAAVKEADKLEAIKVRIFLLNDTQDFSALHAAQAQMEEIFGRGIKSKAFSLPWALKWADELDQQTAVGLRRAIAKQLDSKEISILMDALQVKLKDAFSKQEYHQASDLSEEMTQLYALQDNPKALVNFLERTGKKFSDSGRYGEAERFYQLVIKPYGSAPDIERNLYRIAGLREKLEDPAGAIKLYQKLIADYPSSKMIPDILMKVANIESGLGEKDKAVESLRKVTEIYPDTAYAQESFYLMGMVYYHAKRYAEAITTWEDFLKRFPNSRRVSIVQEYLERADKQEAKP